MSNNDFREKIARICGFGKEFTIKGAPRAHPCVVRGKDWYKAKAKERKSQHEHTNS